MMKKISVILLLLSLLSVSASAQIGEYRNRFSVGGNAGYILSNVAFVTKVPQGLHGGLTFGLSGRYICEKYFSTICAVSDEVNYAKIGWKERIADIQDKPVPLVNSDEAMQYQRTINYIQIPIFAHLAWGRETKGFCGFRNLGPQFGIYLNDSYKSNFDIHNMSEYNLSKRASAVIAQDTLAIQNKFDYGIAGGVGVEYSHPKIGHFLLEGRYYFGLGNIFYDTKRDYFSRSNFGNIVVKITYLFDLTK